VGLHTVLREQTRQPRFRSASIAVGVDVRREGHSAARLQLAGDALNRRASFSWNLEKILMHDGKRRRRPWAPSPT
jgi:hypothetical protein